MGTVPEAYYDSSWTMLHTSTLFRQTRLIQPLAKAF